MGLGRSAAIVIGSFPLAESDRVVTFFAREHGKLRGVARASRRIRSRFGGALELFTAGELVFFDTGRSELVRIDHFDVVEPFAALREDLDRLAHASWVIECAGRLTAERDPQVGLYALLGRTLRALVRRDTAPARPAVCFGVRLLDVLGHRPRLDRCVECGRPYPFSRPALGEGGLVCQGCAAQAAVTPLSPVAVSALGRLRTLRWEEALADRLGRTEAELRAVLEEHMTRLIGQPTRTTKFLREVQRLSETTGERA